MKKSKFVVTALMLVLSLSFSSTATAGKHGQASDRDRHGGWDWDNDRDDAKHGGWKNGHNGKWFVCHRTGSNKNPYVLIQVSSSGKHAHERHGDTVSFSNKGKGSCKPSGGGNTKPAPELTLTLAQASIPVNGKTTLSWSSTQATSCKLEGAGSLYARSFSIPVERSGSFVKGPFRQAGEATYTLTCTGPGGKESESVTLTVENATPPPPPPPPPTTVAVCAFSDLGGGTEIAWIVDYDFTSGAFSGESADGLGITGLVTPPAGMPVDNALYTSGSLLTLESADVSGSGSAFAGQASGADGLALYFIDVSQAGGAPIATTFAFAGRCEELDER